MSQEGIVWQLLALHNFPSQPASVLQGAKPYDIAKGQNFCQVVLAWMHFMVSECTVVRAIVLPVL